MQFHAALAFAVLLAACERSADPSTAPASKHAAAWLCPMCPEVRAAAAGKCPHCGMDLVSRRLVVAWRCLRHRVVVRDAEGECPICGQRLSCVTMGEDWACPEHPELARLGPGACPKCQEPLEARRVEVPHGDHNPRHGGQFFMAPDQWHHLEGILLPDGVFRLYLYDDFTRPIAAGGVRGEIALEDGEREVLLELAPADGGAWLEARDPRLEKTPIALSARLHFAQPPGESVFDFRFERAVDPGLAEAPASPAAAGAPAPELSDASPLPPAEIARELRRRMAQIDSTLAAGQLAELHRPALEAKELALALQARSSWRDALAPSDRERGDAAVREIVRQAWLLDLYGDSGRRAPSQASAEALGRAIELLLPLAE
jgi:Cu+-exporting ATPase